MKKFLVVLAAFMLPMLAGAQAQINTKKVKIADFTEKVTKVVLSGGGFYDNMLQNEIMLRWRISPYEFCTLEQFEELKSNDQYYFLMITQGQFEKEPIPGIQFISVIKGGSSADDGLNEMYEVVSAPFAAAGFPSGREVIFLPALIDIIQEHIMIAMEKDIFAYGGLGNVTVNKIRGKDMKIVFSKDDLNENVTEELMKKQFDDNMSVEDETDADQYMIDKVPGTLVSYVIKPNDEGVGSYSFNLLIDAHNHQLYYIDKHRISEKSGAGFIPADIKRIYLKRK